MSLKETWRKHCHQAHPYQRNLQDGISLLGRETPAYILEEVSRRQAADRGTSSLWAKLAADFGPRHANFIVKHGSAFPSSRSERNSWGSIAQAYADRKRVVRPASAPSTWSEKRSGAENNTASLKRRGSSAQAQLVELSSGDHQSMPLFRRTAEVQAAVEILHKTRVGRMKGKLQKGERRKAAEAAKRAESVWVSVAADSSAVTGQATKKDHEEGPSSSLCPLPTTCSEALRPTCGTGRALRQHQKSASSNWIPTHNSTVGSSDRKEVASKHGGKTRPRSAGTTVIASSTCFSKKRPRSAASGLRYRVPSLDATGATDADGKLGITRARAPIYSFGAAVVALAPTPASPTPAAAAAATAPYALSRRDGHGLGDCQRQDMPSATAVDAERRTPHHHDPGSVAASQVHHRRPPAVSLERGSKMEGLAKDSGRYGQVGRFAADGRLAEGLEGNGGWIDEADTDASAHLGAINVSKLTAVLSHAEVYGHIRAMDSKARLNPNSNSYRGEKIDGIKPKHGDARTAACTSGFEGSPIDGFDECAAQSGAAAYCPSSGNTDSSAAASPGAGPSKGEDRDTTSDGGGADGGEAGEAEEGDSLAEQKNGILRGENGETCSEADPPGDKKARRRRTRELPQPELSQPDCLRGRYARAEHKTKSAYAARRTVAGEVAIASVAVELPKPPTWIPMSMGSAAATRGNSSAISRTKSAASNEPRGGRRGGGKQGALGTATSWRDRIAAVQRRRAELDESRRVEAKRLIQNRAKREARAACNAPVTVSVSVRGAKRILGLAGGGSTSEDEKAKSQPSERQMQAATTIQMVFRRFRQHAMWLGDQFDRDYVSQVAQEADGGGDQDVAHESPNGQRKPVSDEIFGPHSSPMTKAEVGASHKAKKLRQRHLAVRMKRMVRGFICCTQARLLLMQLLWERIEGNILGERRAKRAAVESRAAATIQQLAHIRRIAVGLIKMQNCARAFKLEHQSRQAKRSPTARARSDRQQAGQGKGGGAGTFQKAQQARFEKQECEAILREHGRRGRRLVDVAVRDRVLRDLLYSYRRQHVVRDQKEYLMETSRPPFVDSHDIKRMLACSPEDMHVFSDPKNYHSRPRFTRLALPLREIEGTIQDIIASHVKSQYRDRLKETLCKPDTQRGGHSEGRTSELTHTPDTADHLNQSAAATSMGASTKGRKETTTTAAATATAHQSWLRDAHEATHGSHNRKTLKPVSNKTGAAASPPATSGALRHERNAGGPRVATTKRTCLSERSRRSQGGVANVVHRTITAVAKTAVISAKAGAA